MTDTNPHWYQVRIVDEELPMEYYADESETVSIFAESEAQARIAVTLVYGDRYGVVEFLGGHGIEDDIEVGDPAEFTETRLDGFDPQINAYEVFDQASFRITYTRSGADNIQQTADSLAAARQWGRENVGGDEEAYGPTYDGWTEATHDSILQRVSPRHVDQFLDD